MNDNNFNIQNNNQSFEQAPKRKGKIGLIILIAALVLIITIVIIVINVNLNKGNSSNGISSNENSSNNSDNANGKYNSNNLHMEDTSSLDGTIIDIKNMGDDLYVNTEKKVYRQKYSKFEEILESTKIIKSILFVNDEIVILENKDNSYSMYGKVYDTSNSKISSSFKEIKDIELENVIYAMDSSNSNALILIKSYDDGYFVDKYELDTDLNIKSQNKKISLILSLGMNNSKEVNTIKDIYVADGNKLFFTLTDGKVYETGSSISFSDVKNGYIKLYMEGTTEEELNEVNKVFAMGSSLKYSRPLFEKQNDKNNLYIYNSKSSMTESGTPKDEYKITFTLPTDYNVDNIKNVLIDEDIIMEFDDSKIYVSSKDNVSNLSLNEELSSLNKNNKIKRIALDGSDIVFLMEDGCLYEFDD